MRASEYPVPCVQPSVTISGGILLPETVLETGEARLIRVEAGVGVSSCDDVGQYRDPLARRMARVLADSGESQFSIPQTFYKTPGSEPEKPLYLRVTGPGRQSSNTRS